MNIKRIGLFALALIIMGISYWLAVGANYDSKTVRIDPEAHTLVNSSDISDEDQWLTSVLLRL